MTAMSWRWQVGRTSVSIARTRIEYGGCSVTKRCRRRSRAVHWASTIRLAGGGGGAEEGVFSRGAGGLSAPGGSSVSGAGGEGGRWGGTIPGGGGRGRGA